MRPAAADVCRAASPCFGALLLVVCVSKGCGDDPAVVSVGAATPLGPTLHQDCMKQNCSEGEACMVWHPGHGTALRYTCEIVCGEHGPLCPRGMDCKESADPRGNICVRNATVPIEEEASEEGLTAADARRFLGHVRGIRGEDPEADAILLAHVCGNFQGCAGECRPTLRTCGSVSECHAELTANCAPTYSELSEGQFRGWLTQQLDELAARLQPLLTPPQQEDFRRQASRLGLLRPHPSEDEEEEPPPRGVSLFPLESEIGGAPPPGDPEETE